ncbi:hypothetical protein [Winogradskyella sp. PG-2]|uniref:hypothetical protein n=1 Tax=Winogradskyella sp. PG-2 TaxID=754409 RepID=UPI00045872FD|nr:hypothetical protein [Winogradskyella sp. PG-2]BAO77473.1 hypothetical protein WPG_3243 [Winogradskyella sp. PG-2]
MKGFIKKIIAFLALAIIALVAIVLSSNYIVKSKSTFNIDKDITNLFIGHSHSVCSVNDSIFKNSINLSASGEAYFYNYQKLKLVLDANKQIETLFIEFANNQVDSVMDDWTWGYEKMSYYLPFYSPFMESDDFNLLLDHNSTDLFASYSIATRKHLYRILSGDYDLVNDVGSFEPSMLSKVDELIAKKDFNPTLSKNLSLSKTNLSYLRKMIDLCKANNIKVFLIRSPQHPLYADLKNESVYKDVLKTQFNDVELFDFDAMEFPNSHYLDLHHLNYNGANEFSTLFNNLLENNLLNSPRKQRIIDSSIKAFNEN